jgi:hypothetical protein
MYVLRSELFFIVIKSVCGWEKYYVSCYRNLDKYCV